MKLFIIKTSLNHKSDIAIHISSSIEKKHKKYTSTYIWLEFTTLNDKDGFRRCEIQHCHC